MANVFNKSGNLIYIDSASFSAQTIDIDNLRILGINIHVNTGTNGVLILGQNDKTKTTPAYPVMLKLEVPHAEENKFFDFSYVPLVFPQGLRIITVSNADVTIIYESKAAN